MAAFASVPAPDVPSASPGRIYFQHLDGLRFWAFFAVFLSHSVDTTRTSLAATPAFRHLLFWSKSGVLGVSFFFVLSGFLITYLLLVEHERSRRIDVPSFYVRRVLRIWPLYFACVATMYLLRPGIPAGSVLPPLGYYLAFLPNFALIDSYALPAGQEWYLGPLTILWSIGVEEQFYLAWPLLIGIALPARVGKPKAGQPARLRPGPWALLMGVCVLSLGFRIWRRHDYAALHYHTLGVIGDMAVGGLAALGCYSSKRVVEKVESLNRSAIIAAYTALALAVLAHTSWGHLYWLDTLDRPFLAAGFAFVILEQCYARHSFYKCGRSRVLCKLGAYTYGLYCLHPFGIIAAQKIVLKLGLDASLWQLILVQTPLALVASLLLATLSHHLLEKPFLRLKRRFAHVQTT